MVNFMDFYYTEPGTLAGQYMRQFWHPIYRAEDLKPGWAKPIKIMGEQFTLYRGDDGTPHVVDFRCPHRQTQLSVGWVEGDCIRCRFHGWKFDSSGQCIEQPAEKESFAEKIRIRSCPTQEYLKLIFVYFGEGEPPPLPAIRISRKTRFGRRLMSGPATTLTIWKTIRFTFRSRTGSRSST